MRIYSLTTFTLLSTITGGHRRSVRCCAWKPQPQSKSNTSKPRPAPVLATGSFDATAAIWIGQPPTDRDGEEADATITRGADEDAQDEDEDDYHFAVVLEGHDSEIKSLAWSYSGTYLATCSRDKSVWLWESLGSGDGDDAGFGYAGPRGFAGDDDEDNYETVAVLQEHDGDVKCVAWHPEEETCLASASYDEAVRVWREDPSDGEWGCVAVLEGHRGTVWAVDWEGGGGRKEEGEHKDRVDPAARDQDGDEGMGMNGLEAVSGPRLISCSDDKSIRVWRRRPKAPKPAPASGPRIPSSIRSSGYEEEWYEEAQLPQRHERAIYAVAWSKKTGRVVSVGSDGRIVVYQESEGARAMDGTTDEAPQIKPSSWTVVKEIEGAHGVYEINHVCWAKRWDRGKTNGEEEVIISTGDDGEVKVWTLDIVS